MHNVSFHNIISDNTHYGIIWSGLYNSLDCVIKVVLLNTGIHYNKLIHKYQNNSLSIKTINAHKYFALDDTVPYLHTLYHKKKSMSVPKFTHEFTMLKIVNNINLAPKVFHHWIDQTSYPVHYGFIVMERLSKTVKDIILERDLISHELNYIRSRINKLHKNNIKHGDLKPSNIGVYLDSHGYINKIRIIDWAKGEYTHNKHMFITDLNTFSSHIKKNTAER